MKFTDVETAFKMQEKGKADFYKLCPIDDDIDFYWTGRIDSWDESWKAKENMVNIGLDKLSAITGCDFEAEYSEGYSAMFFITKGARLCSHFSLPCFRDGEIPERFKIDSAQFLEIEARLT